MGMSTWMMREQLEFGIARMMTPMVAGLAIQGVQEILCLTIAIAITTLERAMSDWFEWKSHP